MVVERLEDQAPVLTERLSVAAVVLLLEAVHVPVELLQRGHEQLVLPEQPERSGPERDPRRDGAAEEGVPDGPVAPELPLQLPDGPLEVRYGAGRVEDQLVGPDALTVDDEFERPVPTWGRSARVARDATSLVSA